MGGGQRLKVLDMGFGVVVQNDAGVEQVIGVEDIFNLLHQLVSRGAPFLLDKWRHVPAGSVLGLEGTVVGVDHHVDHFIHEIAIAGHLALNGKVLGEDKVQIALEGVAEDYRFVVMVFDKQALQFESGVGQVLGGKRNVLDDDRGPGFTYGTHGRKQPLANFPQRLIFGRNSGKLDGHYGVELSQ